MRGTMYKSELSKNFNEKTPKEQIQELTDLAYETAKTDRKKAFTIAEDAYNIYKTLEDVPINPYLGVIYAESLNLKGKYKEANKIAQESEIEAEKTNDKKLKADIQYLFGFLHWFETNIEEAEKSFAKALEMRIKINDDKGIANAYNSLGSICERRSEYDKALVYFNKALEINLKLNRNREIVLTYSNIGLIYWKYSDYKTALEYFLKAYSFYDSEHPDKALFSNVVLNIGNVYHSLQYYDKALEYFNETVELSKDLPNKRFLSRAYNNIGALYSNQKINEKALTYFEKSLAIKEKLNDIHGIAYTLTNIGIIYADYKDEKKAVDALSRALEIREQTGDKRGVAFTCQSFANLYISLKNYDKAEEYLKRVLEILPEIKSKRLQSDIYKTFSELYFEQKKFEEAYKHHKRYNELKDELYNEELTDKIADMQTKYETVKKEKEAEIYRLKNVELVEANELLKVKNEKISAQKKELEKLNKELYETNATKDKFFSIIAHDLRSPINSILSFINMINMLSDKLSKNRILELTKELNSVTKNASVLLENLLFWSRSQTNTLKYNPEVFQLKSLTDNIGLLLDKQAESKGVSLISLIEPNIKVYADPNMMSAVIRNLAGNSIKFTPRGGKVILSAEKTNGYTEISISDTGVGIPEDVKNRLFKIGEKITSPGTNNEKGFGLGLILCKEFVEKMQGEIEVESEVGKGTVFRFSVPNTLQ